MLWIEAASILLHSCNWFYSPSYFPTFPGSRQTKKKAKAASFPGASNKFRDSIVLAVMRIRWRWNSPIGTVSLGAGKSWHWLQVGLSDSHQNYHPEKRKIYQTRNHDQLHVFLIKKNYPDAKAAYWKFCLNPTPPPSPEQTIIMQPIKCGIYLNLVSAKAIEFLALLNFLERRKFIYII